MSIELHDMFDKTRFPSVLFCIPLVFYLPLGCVLATVRFFIGIQALLLSTLVSKLPKLRCILLRVMCLVLGIVVWTEESQNYSESIKIIICNHVTNFDHLAMNLVLYCIVPSVWDLPPFLNWVLGYTEFGASEGRLVLIKNVQAFLKDSTVPALVFPEGATTNSKKGLLKFNSWPFLLNYDVQPVTIQVSRPAFAKITPSVLGSRWWSDMLWFLFVPYTIFTIRFLPVVNKDSAETGEAFCKRVQKIISRQLDLTETNFTSADKDEYAKLVLISKK